MENDFKTLEGVLSLLKQGKCTGKENCMILAYKDTSHDSMKYGALGGAVGALGGAALTAMAGATAFLDGAAKAIGNFDGLIINQTEKGLGFLPLTAKGIQWTLRPDKLSPKMEGATFIEADQIKFVKIKKYNIFNKKVQKIRIKIGDKTIYLMARLNERGIEYQEENLKKLMEKYPAK